MTNSKQQLESVICDVGSIIAGKADKNDIEKALGVLCNDGVYAYYVFVKSLGKRTFLEDVEGLMRCTKTQINKKGKKDKYQQYFKELSGDINDLLFFKEMLEQVLTYARYHAKARVKASDNK